MMMKSFIQLLQWFVSFFLLLKYPKTCVRMGSHCLYLYVTDVQGVETGLTYCTCLASLQRTGVFASLM